MRINMANRTLQYVYIKFAMCVCVVVSISVSFIVYFLYQPLMQI